MFAVSKKFKFESAHRLLDYEGDCAHLHGHTYYARIEVMGTLDGAGMVLDFREMKPVKVWIDKYLDHGVLANMVDFSLIKFLRAEGEKLYIMKGNPTAENIAKTILATARDLLGEYVRAVTVWEGDNAWARATVDV